MSERALESNETIENILGVKLVKPFEQGEYNIEGCISVFVEGLEKSLNFDVSISPQYPFKSHDTETIKFTNPNLLDFKHIMPSGVICIHTAHSPILSQKLVYDIESVKVWIKKYYINKDKDVHYEHLIVEQKTFKGNHYVYFFNEVDYAFKRNEFGFIDYSILSNGVFHKDNINSNIFQVFLDKNRKEIVDVHWNFQLKNIPKNTGLFIFLEDAPSKNQRWVFDSWEDFETILPQDFLVFLHSVEKKYSKDKGKTLPLFLGYNISKTEIHWESIILEIGKFPIYGERVNKKWLTRIEGDRKIDWSMTRNCSYKYFFGRGKLTEKFTNGKILIIGIGALGSIIAKTLARCGCTKIDFIDIDVKEPENVCRSEYSFFSGITNKVNDLINELCLISPFFEPTNGDYELSEMLDYFMKSHLTNNTTKKEIETYLNRYDIIFDCTADNDLLYVLSQMNIDSILLNFSISNHAKYFVCATEPNRYHFISTQFESVLDFDIDDLYNPTGCWSPTFKASYNDINLFIQYAIKHINLKFKQGKSLRNFILDTKEDDFGIILKEF